MPAFGRLHRVVAGLAAVVVAASGTPAIAGWNGAEWGMTPQEVEAATNGFARVTRDTLPREGRDARVSNRAEFENELSDFEVEYYHDSNGLDQIRLMPRFDDCADVLNAFVDAFGQPIEYNEQVILRNFVWHDEANDNRIVLTHSTANMCTIYFYSLAEYSARMEA